MTKEQNIRAILECVFNGFTEERIETAVKGIIQIEQKPCDDAISRERAIKDVCFMMSDCFDADEEQLDAIETTINEIPPVAQKSSEDMPCITPEEMQKCKEVVKKYTPSVTHKSGKWIAIDEEPHEVWECDHCGFVIDGSGCIDPYDYRDTYKFCPNCGAKMESEVKE